MILENSPGLDKAIVIARRLARAEQADAVQPAHLLIGLLAEEEAPPARMLLAAGLTTEALEQAVAALQTPPTPEEDSDAEVGYPVSARVRRILKRAQKLAAWHSAEGTLTSDLVLLALLDLDETERERLIALGLDYALWQRQHHLEPPSLTLDEPLQLDQAPASEIARVLDACANRGREALRVLEDYARFVLDDAFLSRELKTLRHELTSALAPLRLPLLAQRDTIGDVGVSISTPQEESRESLEAVMHANAKRLQEALRSLEEFGKVSDPAFGRAFESLRYRAYTIEKALSRSGAAQERLAAARLYVLVTESLCRNSLLGTVREALEGGVDVVQLREKERSDRSILESARSIRTMTREHGALFILNDRPDLALLCHADGVHLGHDDVPVAAARRILGPGPLIGVSTHDMGQLREAIRAGADYVGIGPVFPSATKTFDHLAGLAFIKEASAETSLPAFALGGITKENLETVRSAGASRIAVSQAVCASADPREAARELRRLM